MNSLSPLELNWTGRPRSISSLLLRSGPANIVIDPGPASTLDAFREQLASHGLDVRDLDAIFLTHIHLDHAGATGSLVRDNPNLKVYVHSRGATHMVNPTLLLQSAGRLYGGELVNLFGEFLPVPERNLRVIEGGETLPMGDTALDVIYTPGHASHHVTYFDPSTKIAFVGDTAGICIEGHPLVLPATPPPDINLELWSESLDAIERLKPQQLFRTHFGFSKDPPRHLANYRIRLKLWSDVAAKILSSGLEDTEGMEEFAREVSAEAEPLLTPAELEHYRYNAQLRLSWLGLSRYHKKRAAALSHGTLHAS